MERGARFTGLDSAIVEELQRNSGSFSRRGMKKAVEILKVSQPLSFPGQKQNFSGHCLLQGLRHLGCDHLVYMLRCPNRILAHGLGRIAEADPNLLVGDDS